MVAYIEPVTSESNTRFSRLRADSSDELREFAETAGIAGELVAHQTVDALSWVRCDRRDRRRALRAGAREVGWHDAYTRIARITVDATRPPTGPNFTRFGMLRRTLIETPTQQPVKATVPHRRPAPTSAARSSTTLVTSMSSVMSTVMSTGSSRDSTRAALGDGETFACHAHRIAS